MNGLPDTGNPLEDSMELGRGLMRGNKDEFKLGYDWKAATYACLRHYDLDSDQQFRLAVYLRGFSIGLQHPDQADTRRLVAQGVEDGAAEAANGKVLPVTDD